MDAALFQSVDDFQQLPQRSTETIKPDDAQAVTRPGVVEQLRQTRPAGLTRPD